MTTSLRHLIGLGLLLLAGATQALDLYAQSGTTTLPDGTGVTVLGYTTGSTDVVASPGGPTIDVVVGATVSVTLYNMLSEATALTFQGQGLIPDTVGVAGGGSKTYTFTAASPGTFLYEAAPLPNAQHQAAMGLVGALVVRPATASQAYDTGATAFTKEAVLLLSELDPALNAAPAAFDLRNFAPKYFLINGKAYPATASIPAVAGDTVLLRYVNAGVRHHSMTLLGLDQLVVAKDGSPLAYPGKRVAESIAPGQTMDAIATIPAGATGQFALYDGNLALFNNRAPGFGGMLTFLAASGTAPAAGPIVTALSLASTTATATITAGAGRAVAAAQAWVDAGVPIPMAFAAGSWTATIPAPSAGSHLLSVRGQDDLGTWGSARTLAFSVDTAGPATTGLVLAPNPSNGTVAVILTGTGDDRASGGANVASWEYSIDGGTAVGTTLPGTSPVASLSATIAPATVNALSAGAHVVSVRSRDALGNWGAPATVSLVVDKTGPVASAYTIQPTNGSAPARLTVTLTDAASSIAAGEGFLGAAGASGTGFPLIPSDGLLNGLVETMYADIPASTIAPLIAGNHPVVVHGRDAAGTWGATLSASLLVDRTAPTFTSVGLSVSNVAFGSPVTVTATGAADPAVGGLSSGVAGGQVWLDSATLPANPIGFAGTSVTLTTLPGGDHTVYLRVRDAAGNWSAIRGSTGTLRVVQAVDDTRTIAANNNATQNSDQAALGLLANDLPIGVAGRTVKIASAPIRLTGTGTGSVTVACQGGGAGTAAAPAIGGNTVCTNGAYRLVLHGVGATGAARNDSKVGTFSFTYTETLNGVTTPPATVTITVNP